MAELKTKYLDQAGLGIFYGIVKKQWEAKVSESVEDLRGELTGTSESTADEVSLYGLKNALAAEVDRATKAEAAIIGTSADAAGTLTLHGLNAADIALAESLEDTNEALGNEVKRAEAAETALGGRIDTEIQDRKDAVQGVQDALDEAVKTLEDADTALDGKITTEKGRAEAAETALGGRIDTEIQDRKDAVQGIQDQINDINADRMDASAVFGALDAEWHVNDLVTNATGLNVLSLDQSTKKYISKDGKVYDTADEAGNGYKEVTIGKLNQSLGIGATADGEKLTIKLTGVNGSEVSTDVDLSSIVLDNYISAITYHHVKEEGVEDVVAPYIKFTWATNEGPAGEDKVLRVPVADLVNNVEEGDGITIETSEGAGPADGGNGASVQTVKISDAFKNQIWGAGDGVTEVSEGYSNFTTATAAIKANAQSIATEVTDRKNAINSVLGDENSEASSATISGLRKSLDAEIAAREADVNAEEERALAAEKTLTENLAKEVTDRGTAVQGVQDALDDAVEALEAADTTLDGKITTEKGRAEAAETALGGRIDTEIQNRKDAVQAVQDQIDNLEDNIIGKLDVDDEVESATIGSVVYVKDGENDAVASNGTWVVTAVEQEDGKIGVNKKKLSIASAEDFADLEERVDALEGEFGTSGRVTNIENWIDTAVLSEAEIYAICGESKPEEEPEA